MASHPLIYHVADLRSVDLSIRMWKSKQGFLVLVNLSSPGASLQILRLTDQVQERTVPASPVFGSYVGVTLYF